MILSSLFFISQTSSGNAGLSKSTQTENSYPSTKPNSISQSSNNLTIFSNSQLIQVAQTNGWTGDGSKVNPILIGNFSISNAYPFALQFENVNLWVRINNISITHSDGGISLINVENFHFENISISNLIYQYVPLVIDSSTNVNITSFTITDYAKHISIENSRNIKLTNSNIAIQTESYDFGITIFNSKFFEFINNSVALWNPNNIIGVSVYNSSSVSMSQNNFETNSSFYVQNSEFFTLNANFIISTGLTFDTTPDLVIEYNTIEGKGIQFNNIGFEYPIQYDQLFQYQITNNSINGLPLLYYYNETNIFIRNLNFYQALLVLCNNVTFQKSSFQQIDILHSENISINDSSFIDVNMLESDRITITNCDISGTVFFLSTNNLLISSNIFNFNKDKIDSLLGYPLHKYSNQYTEDYYIKSDNITIKYNTFHNKLELHSTINILIEGNKFSLDQNKGISNVFNGLEIYLSKNIEIVGNELGENLANGILLTDSNNITVVNNNIINNYGVGIGLFNTNNSRIRDNTILKNTRGIVLTQVNNIDISNNNISEQKEKYVSTGNSKGYYDNVFGYGIYISGSSNISIINNKLRFNSKTAIYERNSFNITRDKNIIEWNGDQVSALMMIVDIILVLIIIVGLGVVVFFKIKQEKILKKIGKKD